MGPVSTENYFDLVKIWAHVKPTHFQSVLNSIYPPIISSDAEKVVQWQHVFLWLFQYGAAYPPNQYGVPPGPYPGTPTSNGQVHNKNFQVSTDPLIVLQEYSSTWLKLLLSLTRLICQPDKIMPESTWHDYMASDPYKLITNFPSSLSLASSSAWNGRSVPQLPLSTTTPSPFYSPATPEPNHLRETPSSPTPTYSTPSQLSVPSSAIPKCLRHQ